MTSSEDHSNDDGSAEQSRQRFEEELRAALHDVFSATSWIVAVEIDQGAIRLAGDLRKAGATEVLAVGARRGTGALNADDQTPLVSMNLPSAGSMVADIQSAQAYLEAPDDNVQAQIDAWDPDRRARAIGGLTMKQGPVAGRPSFGLRPQAWLDLEDKLVIEALWAKAGIPVAPSAQVALADTEALLAEHARLATDLGTVWAGDNSAGWHGGGAGTHWVPNVEFAARFAEELGYEKVRIMPFVEGVPCSVHGMVLPPDAASPENPDGVAVFRPSEMMVLRDHSAHQMIYGRAANFWDPAPADREAMRDVARRVGVELRRSVGFRGVFTVDGVMSATGFVPTEVNTRYGAALASQIDTLEGDPIDLFLVNLCVVEGVLDDVDLAPVESWVMRHHDANRWARGFFKTPHIPEPNRSGAIVLSSAGMLQVRDAEDDDTDDTDATGTDSTIVATVDWGPSGDGGLLMFDFRAEAVATGPSTAPLLVELIEAVDRAWDVDAVAVSAATAVR